MSSDFIRPVPYLLVQEKSAVYKFFSLGAISTASESRVQLLLDNARTTIGGLMRGSLAGITLEAYTLLEPIDHFLGRAMADIENELGDIDDDFLRTKAAIYPGDVLFSSLKATDGKLLVIFRMPTLEKRARSPTEPIFDRFKRTKLATTTPSTLALPSNYESTQRRPSQKILDDCPIEDADIPPISLLYDGFGHFLDILDAKEVPGLSDVDMEKLCIAVDDFAEKMCKFYDNEDKRRDVALPILGRIFSARSGAPLPELCASSIGSVRSDGHNSGIVAEFKNCSANNNAIAEVEMTGYVAHLHAKEVSGDLFERWRVPCLGLTVVGCDIKFYAIVAVDHQYRLVGLTSGLSCIASTSEGRERKLLYRAFAAASVVLARILQDTKELVSLPPIPGAARRFPSITKLAKWPPRSDSKYYVEFQIVGFYPDRRSYRLLYVANTSGPEKQTFLIKFVREYSIDLHNFCAERGHAPRILAFDILPGGWRAVAMEYIDSATLITSSPGVNTHRERWAKELKQLVVDFHERGLVHGDLRDANILCDNKDTVMLVDFDWGGKDGEVFYPTHNLNEELRSGQQEDNLKITKDDDDRVLKITLKKLG